ncbi:hypothetical protein [Desulfopila inferna]|uniref:hypothetical protein n=1 Tax=Desulfopila inferna TaxID=468528 RepID=UPI0019636768|nr:hypothetical protein [Desulfopila inferna]MBM9604130.1 hypothetical protein [Desulfopila inferna]
MSEQNDWKKKLTHELNEYFVNFLYLSLFFCVFTTYRRLLMAEYDISYGDYGISIIKALILAKVVMLGDMLKLGRRLKDRPLMYLTLFKTVLFTAWVLLFHMLEITVSNLLHSRGLAGAVHEFMDQFPYELLAHLLIVLFAFLPFFAVRELNNILGEGKIRQLFFSSGLLEKTASKNVRRNDG